ncbi:fusion protein [Achimota pararubulavirus 3]|uniref:Fusion glycoprotein F0 n=1 Tax=Achimota pararubulavirus 3 TaxID=2791004 RepID=A0A875J4S3_9MONO|nr:fusion protein [Achimota pararubulavirus 3]
MKPTLLFIISTLIHSSCQLDPNQLIKSGAIIKNKRQLNFYTQGAPSYIVVKLIPTINYTNQDCALSSLQRYNKTLDSILAPLADNLHYLKDNLVPGKRTRRFAGVAIGLAALGVAAAAQVTAAIALVKAQENAKQLGALADSIQNTNLAVNKLSDGLNSASIAIQAIQDQVNTVINPALTQLSCEVADAKLAGILNLYLIELLTVFKNQITNPALSTLSIQALSRIMQGTLIDIRANNTLKFGEQLNAMTAGLVTGQVVQIDMKYKQLIIAAFIPSIAPLTNAIVIDLIRITANLNNSEVMVQLPDRIMEQAGTVYQFPGTDCVVNPVNMYCPYSSAKVLSPEVHRCIHGELQYCLFSKVVGSFPTRFASSNGIIFANCKQMVCTCSNPQKVLYQGDQQSLLMIDAGECQLLNIGVLSFKITQYSNVTFDSTNAISAGQVLITNPLDLSIEIQNINNSIKESNKLIDYSNFILKTNPILGHSNVILIVIIVCFAIMVVYLIVVTYILKVVMDEVRRMKRREIYTIEK